MKEKGLSKGEFANVAKAVGGLNQMLNCNCKDKATLSLIKHTVEEDREERILENQKVLITPIVRNGKLSTLGYQPEVWKTWK
jgi:arsenate reductase-like glutaredoxin family protein